MQRKRNPLHLKQQTTDQYNRNKNKNHTLLKKSHYPKGHFPQLLVAGIPQFSASKSKYRNT